MVNFEAFREIRVAVIGDVMLDQYWWGHVERISPEAPVPVVAIHNKSSVAGGAANVAANILGLGARVDLIGCIGHDEAAVELLRTLDEGTIGAEHLVRSDAPTCVKTRIIGGSQQIVRVDSEPGKFLDEQTKQALVQRFEKVLPLVDIVIISDYAKGVVSEFVAQAAIKMVIENDKMVLVDPKGKDYAKYNKASVLTPNIKELLDATGLEDSTEKGAVSAGERLMATMGLEHLVVTRGEKGMLLFAKGKQTRNLSTMARTVFDVTGAGDTVIASLAVALASGSSFFDACSFANKTAGVVVGKAGTASISLSDLNNL
ncbi:MAG: D-glycero-beta-D-manno-heptose-7-phosphate kinase [Pyrinomonadaceae bacterium]